MVKNLEKQVYVLSIISLVLSIVFGLGIIYAISTIVMCYYLRKNYKVDMIKMDQAMFYCVCAMACSIIFIMLEYNIIKMY